MSSGLPPNSCIYSAQCNATSQVCSMANPGLQCQCEAGVDICTQVGQCIDFCDSNEAKQLVATANSQVLKCDPFQPNACSGTLICTASTTCLQTTCVPGTGIVNVPCAGLCMPAVRQMVSGRLSDDVTTLSVQLNAPVKSSQFPCSAAFTSESLALLGYHAYCMAEDRTLNVRLDPSATLVPGSNITLKSNQQQMSDKLQNSALFTGSAVIATCTNCVAPVAAIVGPKVGAG